MRCVPLDELKAGDRLARDVYAGAEMLPLLRAGIRVSDSYRASLQRAGVIAVWIDDALSDGIEPMEVLEESTKRRAATAIHGAFRKVSESKDGASLSERAVEDIREALEALRREDIICERWRGKNGGVACSCAFRFLVVFLSKSIKLDLRIIFPCLCAGGFPLRKRLKSVRTS